MLAGLSLGVRAARRTPFVPRLELLEGRDCPAAPTITSFTATQVAGAVVVTGTVSDETPETVVVEFSGAASGVACVNSAGEFSETISASAIDTIFATANDDEQLQSSSTSTTLTNNAPVIVDFDAWREWDSPGNIWTFSGKVIDEYPTGYVVLSGLPSLGTQGVWVDENGYFSWTCELSYGEEGMVTANFTDFWGVAAQEASKMVRA